MIRSGVSLLKFVNIPWGSTNRSLCVSFENCMATLKRMSCQFDVAFVCFKASYYSQASEALSDLTNKLYWKKTELSQEDCQQQLQQKIAEIKSLSIVEDGWLCGPALCNVVGRVWISLTNRLKKCRQDEKSLFAQAANCWTDSGAQGQKYPDDKVALRINLHYIYCN